MDLSYYTNQLESLATKLNSDKFIKDALEEKRGLFMTQFKLRIYRTGRDGQGNPFTPPYSKMTISLKKGKGQITSHVTLRDTGDFYKSFLFTINRNTLWVDSSDKALLSKLNTKYSTNVLGMNADEKQFIDTTLNNELTKLIEKINKNNID